jgi:DNA polymerase III subunit gamma/tau
MSYISFYRKWRPQAFSEVIGQEHIVKTLQNAISKNRLVHGYMFCGPKGTGKTSIARIFAKAINCVNGPAVEPCNKCDNCISITAGSNVDIVEIDGASNRGIENIRDLREKIKFLPVFLRKKIYIIDEAHQITDAAFNALLKTLEEPPEHVIFVMATTDPNKVIKTIMSRCQRFDFEPISLEGLRHKLKDIASSENIDITDSALSIVAKYSDGSLRDAEGILEQLSSFSDGRITVDDVSSILGIIDQDMLFELANIILEKNISQGLLFVSRLFSTSFSINVFISEFLEHLYSLYVIKNYENPADILDMPEDFKENYYNQAGLFTPLHLESLIDLFTGLLAQIKECENPKTFFKAAVIKALNTEIPGQKKMPSAESIPGREANKNAPGREANKNAPGRMSADNIPEWETADNDPDRKSTETMPDKTAVKNLADTVLDKAVDKEAAETAPNKTVTVNEADKKDFVELKEDIPESLLQDSKKAAGCFSQLTPEIWENVLVKIKAKSVPLHAVLKEVRRFNIQGNKIIFSLEPKNRWHKTELNKLENRELIQELLKSLTEKIFEITFDFISDKNISESIDLAHTGRKILNTGDLHPENKETLDFDNVSTNAGNPVVDKVINTVASQKSRDSKDAAAGSDTYGYFEKKFKVKEK